MTVEAVKRQIFADVPVREVQKTLRINVTIVAGHVFWLVTVGSGKTKYIAQPTELKSGTVLTITNPLNNRQQRWEVV